MMRARAQLTAWCHRRLGRTMRRTAQALVVSGAVLVALAAVAGSTAASTPKGSATFAAVGGTPANFTALSGTQASTTGLIVMLPAGAACSQASTHGTAVYSFLAPQGTDIKPLTYTGGTASAGYFLADGSGTPFPGA